MATSDSVETNRIAATSKKIYILIYLNNYEMAFYATSKRKAKFTF